MTFEMKFLIHLQWKKYMVKMIQYFLYHFRNICKPQNENGIMIYIYISEKRYLKYIFLKRSIKYIENKLDFS
jgi:hypothetical protein